MVQGSWFFSALISVKQITGMGLQACCRSNPHKSTVLPLDRPATCPPQCDALWNYVYICTNTRTHTHTHTYIVIDRCIYIGIRNMCTTCVYTLEFNTVRIVVYYVTVTYIYIYICLYLYLYVYLYIYRSIFYICIYVWVSVCVCVCVCLCVCLCVCQCLCLSV